MSNQNPYQPPNTNLEPKYNQADYPFWKNALKLGFITSFLSVVTFIFYLLIVMFISEGYTPAELYHELEHDYIVFITFGFLILQVILYIPTGLTICKMEQRKMIKLPAWGVFLLTSIWLFIMFTLFELSLQLLDSFVDWYDYTSSEEYELSDIVALCIESICAVLVHKYLCENPYAND